MFCPKCKNRESKKQIEGFEELKAIQKKRYGKIPCNNCLIELIGGYNEYEKQKINQILKEMGIEKPSNK